MMCPFCSLLKMSKGVLLSFVAMAAMSCGGTTDVLSMIVVDPGHFHASLLQKNALPGVSDTVRVFAPSGSELEAYRNTISAYNSREDNPTSWVLDIYEGEDYLDHIPVAHNPSFAVFAGNNRLKSSYILHCVEKGYHVISDKPMAINAEGFRKLETAYDVARKKGLVIYDLMTERHDVQNIITKEIMSDKGVFGDLNGRIEIEDIHHFFKQVSGKPLIRPMWYFDVRQQGEGIADVTTHFIDLIFWECFPGECVSVADVEVTGATRFPTTITLEEYKAVTGADTFPEYLMGDVKDGNLEVYSNGTIEFTVKGVPVRILMRWDYEPQPGAGDRFHEVIPGTLASIEITQDASTDYERKLFIKTDPETAARAERMLKEKWEAVSLTGMDDGRYAVSIPAAYRHPHEEHFNMVAHDFIECIRTGNAPAWEKENTLTKYHITTTALELAK